MATATAATVPALEIRRTFNASRQRVFNAWTRPEEMKKWSAPGPASVASIEIDLRVGGKYRLRMLQPDGSEHIASGAYREIDPPRKLVYTWTFETNPDVKDTLVTVEFAEKGTGTEVVLRHTGLPNMESRSRHEMGWHGCLEKLGPAVAG